MFITHNFLPNQKLRKTMSEVKIDLFPIATELWEQLDIVGAIERMKNIPHLGGLRIPAKYDRNKYDYSLLQIYLHHIVRDKVGKALNPTYNQSVREKDISATYKYFDNKRKASVADLMQIFSIVYSIGHFTNTFVSSKAIIYACHNDVSVKNNILTLISDKRMQLIANRLIEERDFNHFHLINSFMILDKCDNNKESILIAKELIIDYLDSDNCSVFMKSVFESFRRVRNLAFLVYDLQITNTPFVVDLHNTQSISVLLKELLSEYNDNTPAIVLLNSLSKMVGDLTYFNPMNVIGTEKMSILMAKKVTALKLTDNYLESAVFDVNHILNIRKTCICDFDKRGILKIKVSPFLTEQAYLFIDALLKMKSVRVGYSFRGSADMVIYVSLRKGVKEQAKVALRIIQKVVSFLSKEQGENVDKDFVSSVKFFLFYLLGNKEVVIKPTITQQECVISLKGAKKRKSYLDKLIKNTCGNEDQTYEVEFMRSVLEDDNKNDTAIVIPASILVTEDGIKEKDLSEYDGMVIFPYRKDKQVLFLEAKNRKRKTSEGKKCLINKLNAAGINYNEDSIDDCKPNAYLYYSV